MNIKYDALTRPVIKQELIEFNKIKQQQSDANDTVVGFGAKATVLIIFIVVMLFASFNIFFFVSFFVCELLKQSYSLAIIITLLLIVSIIVSFYVWWKKLSPEDEEYRLSKFAEANDLSYTAEQDKVSSYDGMIFNNELFASRGISNRFTGKIDDVSFEVANYNYSLTVYTGKTDNYPRTYGYILIHLGKTLPHMVLVSKAENLTSIQSRAHDAMSRLIDRDQKMSLEGDFDKYFTLYVPKDYDKEALYFLTPDLMASLIDELLECSVEIVDDQLFIYCPDKFNFLDVKTVQKIFKIINMFGQKLTQKVDRYDGVGSQSAAIVPADGPRLDVEQSPNRTTVFVSIVFSIAVISFVIIFIYLSLLQ